MTLKEAVESGKPLKRRSWDWGEKWWRTDPQQYVYSYEDAVATDYILKEEEKFLWAMWIPSEGEWVLDEMPYENVSQSNFVIGKTAIKLAKVES